MKFKDHSVREVFVGLHRIGIAGLADAVKTAEASGLGEQEAVVDLMTATLAARNYIPDRQAEAYRTALWREFLRHQGQDFSAFYSETPVTIEGKPGPEFDDFSELVQVVLATLALKPVIAYEAYDGEGAGPTLEIRGEVVARGTLSRLAMETAVRHSLSDW